MLTQKEARRLFDYDAESGELTWKVSLSNSAVVDAKVRSTNSSGYLQVGVNRKRYYVHRLIWLWVYGYFPEHNIDHINRNSADNRLENLREVNQQCNMRNAKQFSSNTSGVTGVYWSKQHGKWQARIAVNSRQHHLGLHQDLTEAVLHRLAAEQCLNWEGCDSSSTAYQYYLKEVKR